MKKIYSLLFAFFLIFPLFSQNETLIYSEDFDGINITFFSASLSNETINIVKYTGENVLIEIDSNNLNYKPQINLMNQTLEITSSLYKPSSVDYCNINVYFPVNFRTEQIEIKTINGEILLKNTTVLQDITLSTDSGKITVNKIKTENLQVTSFSSTIECSNINCETFLLSSKKGDISLSITEDPVATSQIVTEEGSIVFEFPKDGDFVVFAMGKPVQEKKKGSLSPQNQRASNIISGPSLSFTTKVQILLISNSSIDLVY